MRRSGISRVTFKDFANFITSPVNQDRVDVQAANRNPELLKTFAKNFFIAHKYYSAAGYSPEAIPNHIAGCNFTKPIEVITMPPPAILCQFNGGAGYKQNKPLRDAEGHMVPRIGNYWAEPSVKATELGIHTHAYPRHLDKDEQGMGESPSVVPKGHFYHKVKEDPNQKGPSTVTALRSEAHPIMDTWSTTTPTLCEGGGIQLFSREARTLYEYSPTLTTNAPENAVFLERTETNSPEADEKSNHSPFTP